MYSLFPLHIPRASAPWARSQVHSNSWLLTTLNWNLTNLNWTGWNYPVGAISPSRHQASGIIESLIPRWTITAAARAPPRHDQRSWYQWQRGNVSEHTYPVPSTYYRTCTDVHCTVQYVCNVTQIKMWCDTRTQFSASTFVPMSVLSIKLRWSNRKKYAYWWVLQKNSDWFECPFEE